MYYIKSASLPHPHGSLYRTKAAARSIASRFNNSPYYESDYEVFGVLAVRKVEAPK